MEISIHHSYYIGKVISRLVNQIIVSSSMRRGRIHLITCRRPQPTQPSPRFTGLAAFRSRSYLLTSGISLTGMQKISCTSPRRQWMDYYRDIVTEKSWQMLQTLISSLYDALMQQPFPATHQGYPLHHLLG